MAVQILFDGEELGFRPDGAKAETREVMAEELAKFAGWARNYEAAVRSEAPNDLIRIGRELYGWLHGSGAWLKALNEGTGARALCFEVRSDPGEAERRFLDVPWELLATEHGFVAADAERPLVLTRRLGTAGKRAVPAHGDLLLMFMAAAPLGADNLDYEREEVGILEATKGVPLQLRVEESGCLEFLRDRIALEAPIEALHLSCHGMIEKGVPQLLLEDPRGRSQEVPTSELIAALGDNKPPLVFLSACRTAEQPATALPLSLSLVRSGVANVLGWDGSVYDRDAADFACKFYGELARRGSVGYAAAVARQALLRCLMSDSNQKRGRHWHLARVYLGGHGGGPVCTAGKPLRNLRKAIGFEEFLDKEKEVPVASAQSFVGRRRQAQQILGIFRDKESGIGQQAGVLIHGMGRLGKSSLAARVANRLPRHKTVVVFKTYRAHAVLDRVLDALPARTRREFQADWAEAVQEAPAALADALRAILEGPCSAYDPASGKQPILLVIDDLEQILTTPQPGKDVTVQDDYVAVLRAITKTFADVHSASLLLLTSRYRFALSDAQGQDLTRCLADIPLPPMNEREQTKQLRAQQALEGRSPPEAQPGEGAEHDDAIKAQAALLYRCVEAGRGNPGLQMRLTKATLTNARLAAAAVEEVERFHASGKTPTGDIGDFFKQLSLEVYRYALTGDETTLLRAALFFERPVPEAIVIAAGEALGVEALDVKLRRLEGLGLIDCFLPEEGEQALMVNALARPLFDGLPVSDQQQIAAAILPRLANAWRDSDGDLPIGPRSLDLVRIAALAGDAPELLADAAAMGGAWLLRTRHDANTALEVAEYGISVLHKAGLSANTVLLRVAAGAAERLGEGGKQEAFLKEQLTRDADDPRSRAMLWVDWGNLLARKGQVEDALTWLEKAKAAFIEVQEDHSIAGTWAMIANILELRGQYDEALRIRREEELPVYQRLGDVYSFAQTQGRIANILELRGEDDEALRIRQEEELPVYRRLGNIRAIAVVRGQIANALHRHGRYSEALRIRRKEELPIYREIGDVRSIAVTQGKIADALVRRRRYDWALRIRREEEIPVYQRLNDVHSIALTKGTIAHILELRGEYDEALRIRQEEELPVLRELPDPLGISISLFSIAQIRLKKGKLTTEDEQTLLGELRKSFALSQRIGKPDGIADVGRLLGSVLARIRAVDEARTVLTAACDALLSLRRPEEAAAVDQQIRKLDD